MKKVFLALILIVTCFSFVFADETAVDPITYDYIDFAYQPTLSRYNSMGQSGLAAAGRLDSFYTNPATLAQKRFGLSIPTLSVTLYNLQKLVSNEDAMEKFNKIVEGEASNDDYMSLAETVIKNLGQGYGTLATIDGGVGLSLGLFGAGTNFQVKLHSYANGSSNVTNIKIIPELNVAQTLAFGVNIIKTNALKLQVGVAGHFVYKAYFQDISASTMTDYLSEDADQEKIMKQLIWDTPVMGGYAIPIDVGVTLSLANDSIRFSATANNLNGVYKMKSYAGFGQMVNTLAQKEVIEKPSDVENNKTSVDFEVSTPWTLNFGFAFAPDIIFHPVITADLVDMVEMVKNFSSDSFRASDLLLHLNAGAEITLAVVNIRAGINRGYMSVGAGFGILGIRIDATYGWQEFGEELGDKPVDSFTIRFNLGCDK